MELECQKYHPNGLKIACALALKGISPKVTFVKNVHDGAALSVTEDLTSFNLSANASVLYLMNPNSKSEDQSKLVNLFLWETSVLLRNSLLYVQCLSANREDKALQSSLLEALEKLSVTLKSDANEKDISALDIVLFSSVSLLYLDKKSESILQKFPEVVKFALKMKSNDLISRTVSNWYGSDVPVRSWINSVTIPPASTGPHTLSLLKKGAPTTAGEVEEQVKESVKLTAEEIAAAKSGWTCRKDSTKRTKPVTTPVLPVKGERNILITSALPYVNNVPHLGNIIGCVLSADCFARYCRLRGHNVVYICGTDEYGTATETKAISEGLTPKQICDKYNKIHSDVYRDFGIQFDLFGRTTTEQQTKIVHELFWDLEKAGHITRESVEQLYCEKCQRFLADRFVEGVCPHIGCDYEDARGDQCDKCGKLVNATDLGKPRCKLCSATPKIKSSNHLFIDLPSIEPEWQKWFDVSSKDWSHNASIICSSWVRDGLLPRCITRDLKWGVPVPLEGFEDKVFYVWFDAPIGYISITNQYVSDWEKWWKNPDDVELYQFMAKDNVPFHGIIFPCTLTGSPQPWTRVNKLCATEYLNYEDTKFSKSRGVGVFGDDAIKTGIHCDVWRFYLIYIRPESQDTAFSWSDLQMKNNSELLNNLGNFVNRSLKFVSQFFDGKVPDVNVTESDYEVIANVNRELNVYHEAVSATKLKDGLRAILSISRIGNLYIQENEPFKLIKSDRSDEDKARGSSVIGFATNLVHLIALLLDPYMPNMSAQILKFMNKESASESVIPDVFSHTVPAGSLVTKPTPLIKKITDDEIKGWQEKFKGDPVPDAKKAKRSSAASSSTADPAAVERITKLVAEQGNKVRELKAGGASKADVAPEVAKLLQLKKELAAAEASAKQTGDSSAPSGTTKDAKQLEVLVAEQGNKVRELKAGGASKADVAPEVAKLLQLKKELAAAEATAKQTGDSSAPSNTTKDAKQLQALVAEQGNKVRELKAGGASKADVAPEVAKLLQLKKELAAAEASAKQTGDSSAPSDTTKDVKQLEALVAEQGQKVRDLKASGASKDAIKAEVSTLLGLKARLGAVLGVDPSTIGATAKPSKKAK